MTGYRWIQVGEVEDMTPIQLEIVRRVSTRGAGCALYLGDEQQAIFSFLGAGGRALDSVKKLCSGHILGLQRNYRSPDYLVRALQHHCGTMAGHRPVLSPYTDSRPAIADSLIAWKAHPSRLPAIAAAQAPQTSRRKSGRRRGHTRPNEQGRRDNGRTAAAVARFQILPCVAADIFHRAAFKTVWSHLAVILQPTRSHEWALIDPFRAVRTLGSARSLVSSVARCGSIAEPTYCSSTVLPP